MDPIFLRDVEASPDPKSNYIPLMEQLRAQNLPVSQILYLFAFRPERTRRLQALTQEVVR